MLMRTESFPSTPVGSDEVLRIENLHKRFGSLHVLQGIDLTVRRGETVVILGSSGSGKSTLLRCVNFLEMPSEGRIWLQQKLIGSADASGKVSYSERQLCQVRTHVGMVFQQFNLFAHLTALENVMLGPVKVRGMKPAQARELAMRNLERVGVAGKAGEYPNRLSGGQQQRVAIARALAMEPAIMLFDEATSALDPELVGEVLLAMRKLAEEGTTMLIVTHELGFAYNVAHRVVLVDKGRICDEGKPADVLIDPANERSREFVRGHALFRLPEHRDTVPAGR